MLVDELTSRFAALESNGIRGLGIVRGYLSYSGAGKQIVSSTQLSNLNSILANPRVRRFFCSEAPKKRSKLVMIYSRSFFFEMLVWYWVLICFFFMMLVVEYENYYPKDKKEIPKANESKSESKGLFLFFLFPSYYYYYCYCYFHCLFWLFKGYELLIQDGIMCMSDDVETINF